MKPKFKTIRVTRDCINKGVRQNTTSCPIARALKEAGCRRVRVGVGVMEFNGRSYGVPKSVARFVSRFDNGVAVWPFSFRLPL